MDSRVLEFMESLKEKLGACLESFVIYGSAVTGELYRKSDYNTLIVLSEIRADTLDKISKPVRKWIRSGNPVPLIFTAGSLTSSEDAFPMEFLDIKENSITLWGRNFFRNMKVPLENLRVETERELKSMVINLTRRYVAASGNSGEIKKIMSSTISPALSVFKSVLRLYKIKVPVKKRDAAAALPRSIKADMQVVDAILGLKDGRDRIKDAKAVFEAYFAMIERAAKAVDGLKAGKKRL